MNRAVSSLAVAAGSPFLLQGLTELVQKLLLMEARAARIDALISGLTGLALLGSPLLKGTPLAAISPITDSLLVLVVSLVILKDPVQTFLNTLGQAAGASAETEIVRSTRLALEDLLAGLSCWLLDLTVMQVGRTAFVVVYLTRINRWMALPSI